MAFFRSVLTFPQRRPFAFGLGFSCVKTSFADYLVQKYVEKREEIDLKRNFAFGFFGLVYLGGVQYAIYVPLFKKLFPKAEAFAGVGWRDKLRDKPGMWSLFQQVVLDQCVHHPFIYFPSFYIVKTKIQGGSFEEAKNAYFSNINDDMIALWKIWVPATIVNFSFMPMWARIPFVATTSLLWTCILSAMRGRSTKELETALDAPSQSSEMVGNPSRLLEKSLTRQSNYSAARALTPGHDDLVITAFGPDRVGLVADMARAIKQNGGNVHESKMMHVGGDFTVMCHISIDKDQKSGLIAELGGIGDLRVHLSELHSRAEADKEHPIRFQARVKLIGPDRPGLVHALTEFLAASKLNVEQLISETSAPTTTNDKMSGSHTLFVLEADISARRKINEANLNQSLKKLGDRMQVNVEMFEVSHYPGTTATEQTAAPTTGTSTVVTVSSGSAPKVAAATA